MADPRRAHTKEYFLELLLPVSLSLWLATTTPRLCRRDPLTLAGRSGSVSCGVTAPSPWALMRTLLCVCPPSVESVFPPALSKSCNQILLAFKIRFSGNSSSCCWTPRLGSLIRGSELSLQWVDFCGIIVLQFVSHPPCSYGIWFYCDCALPTISLWLPFVFGCGVSFLVSSNVFLSMTVQQLVVILLLSQQGVSTRPSTLPSSTCPLRGFLLCYSTWDLRTTSNDIT